MNSNGAHPHIVFAGGVTAGHLLPGLIVARRLAEEIPESRITFAGCGREFEWRNVVAAKFDYLAVPCRPLPRRLRQAAAFLMQNLAGYRQALRFLADQSVSAVVGLGGYASIPMARAAIRRDVPLILLEQNVLPGRATRWLAPSATLVCTAFEQARQFLSPRSVVRVTGNPIRAGLVRLALAASASGSNGKQLPRRPLGPSRVETNGRDAKGLLLVIGGTSGARSLNENVPGALHKVRNRLRGWRIVHQSGQADLRATRQRYRKLGLEACVSPFIVDMTGVLAQTKLAICRSGGTTLSELAAAGVPAILVPYPHAADDHQRKNADVFTSARACLTLDERELNGELDDHLAGAVSILLNDSRRRAAMSGAMRRLAQPDATWDVATVIRQVAASVA